MTARIYIDEDITVSFGRLLRTRDHDAVATQEAHASGDLDEIQLERATREGRAFVTCNHRDFVRISREWATARKDHGGIIISYRPINRDTMTEHADLIDRLFGLLDNDSLRNVTVSLQDFA